MVRLRPPPAHVAVVRGRELGIGTAMWELRCAAVTVKGPRCREPVEPYGQVATWDERNRYDVDGAGDSSYWLGRYGSRERLLRTFERQRCPVHVESEASDAVPLDVWELLPASGR